MTENIKSSFRDKVKKAPWLDDVTKMAALSKLDYLNAFISHEDWLKDSQIIESDYAKVNKNLFSCTLQQALQYLQSNLFVQYEKKIKRINIWSV